MKDDYLWDKSGEPDPEIQQLEEVLGTLRFQPRELEMPADIRPQRTNYLIRGLAIAAAVALVVLGLGLWKAINRDANPKHAEVQPAKVEPSPAVVIRDMSAVNVQPTRPASGTEAGGTPRRHPSSAVARHRHPAARSSQLSESERAEGKAAKEQLILALRVASSKLSKAQKKTQGNNEIHNQHKTG